MAIAAIQAHYVCLSCGVGAVMTSAEAEEERRAQHDVRPAFTESEQARADALADAETLRLYTMSALREDRLIDDEAEWNTYGNVVGAGRCGAGAAEDLSADTAAEDAWLAAKAAFRAVPGLR